MMEGFQASGFNGFVETGQDGRGGRDRLVVVSASTTSGKELVMLWDGSGTRLWAYEVASGVGNAAVSEDGYVAFSRGIGDKLWLLDPEGSLLWSDATYSPGPLTFDHLTGDIIAMVRGSGGLPANNVWARFARADGSLLASHTYTNASLSGITAVGLFIDLDRNVYVFGQGGDHTESFAVKYDAGGTILVDYATNAELRAISHGALDATGHVAFRANRKSDLQNATFYYTNAGTKVWEAALDSGDGARSLTISRHGHVYHSQLSGGDPTIRLKALDKSDGSEVWAWNDLFVRHIITGRDGAIYMSTTESPTNYSITKLDSTSATVWNQGVPSPSNTIKAIATDAPPLS